MNYSHNKIAWVVTCIYLSLLAIICALMQGCATTGTIAPEIIEQSAAVDTSISQLQTQQAKSAEITQGISDTADNLQKIADSINNPELSAETKKLVDYKKELLDSQEKEQKGTASIQTTYTTVKTTAGTKLVNDSDELNKKNAQLKLSHKWNWVLAGVIIILLLADVGYIFIKFYFHK
jgi:hypothetical protein